MKKEVTWGIHAVIMDDDGNMNYHTHGLDKYNSLELEINLNVHTNIAKNIINTIGLDIANGKEIKDGYFDEENFNCKIAIKEAIEICKDTHIDKIDHRILRIILPDDNFKFPWDDECQDFYRTQI